MAISASASPTITSASLLPGILVMVHRQIFGQSTSLRDNSHEREQTVGLGRGSSGTQALLNLRRCLLWLNNNRSSYQCHLHNIAFFDTDFFPHCFGDGNCTIAQDSYPFGQPC